MIDDFDHRNPFFLETLRGELIENCGLPVFVFTCCCNKNQPFEGTVEEVGRNFLELRIASNTEVIIPLENVVAFRETGTGPAISRCGSRQIFRNRIAQLIGRCVTVPWCLCNEIRVPTGILGEVGLNFLELNNVNNTGQNLILEFSTVCSVMTAMCPTGTPTPTPTPTSTTTMMWLKSKELF